MSFAITRFSGDTVDIPYEVQNPDGSQRNITNETVRLTLSQIQGGPNALPAVTGVHSAPISGQGTVSLAATDTANITGDYFAYLTLTTVDNKVYTFADGGITFKPKPR